MSSSSPKGGLLRGTAIVSAFTLVSRFLGFIRDLLVARLFGAGIYADCFFVAFKIPNLLRSFVAEGALTSAFVPVFSDQIKSGPEVTQRTLSNVIGFLVCLTAAISLVGIAFAPLIVELIAPGFERNPEGFALCVELTRIMFPYVMCISLVAMLNGALNTVHVFGAGAMAQVVMNLVLIAGALIAALFTDENAVRILSYSVVAGGLVQIVVQLPALHRAGLKFKPRFQVLDGAIRQLVRLMLPALLGASIYQISQFIGTQLATLLETGSVSWLFYADRLTQFPIGIFSIALASVLLPTLAGAQSSDDSAKFRSSLENSLRFTSFVMLPVAAGLFIFAEPLISIIFERGAFSSRDVVQSSMAVKAYSFGLWAMSCHSMLSRAFMARKDTLTPTLVGLLTLFVNVAASLILMGAITPIESSSISRWLVALQGPLLAIIPSPELRHAGLALALSISSTISFLILAILISRKVREIKWWDWISGTFKSACSSAAAIAAALTLPTLSESIYLQELLRITAFAATFLLAAGALRSRELQDSLAIVTKRLRK